MVGYLKPTSLDEALHLVAEHPRGVIAGGTVWLPLIHNQMASASAAFVDITGVPELLGFGEDHDRLRIGAAVTLEQLHREPAVPSILRDAAQSCASPEIRRQATIGGNIETALVPGDLLPALWILDAQIELRSSAGNRHLAISSYITSLGSDRRDDELLVSLSVNAAPAGDLFFIKVGRRATFSQSVATLAIQSIQGHNDTIVDLQLVAGAIKRPPLRLANTGSLAIGMSPNDGLVSELAQSARSEIDPDPEYWVTSDYRAAVVGSMVKTGLKELWIK